jgi:hypothetical protein
MEGLGGGEAQGVADPKKQKKKTTKKPNMYQWGTESLIPVEKNRIDSTCVRSCATKNLFRVAFKQEGYFHAFGHSSSI